MNRYDEQYIMQHWVLTKDTLYVNNYVDPTRELLSIDLDNLKSIIKSDHVTSGVGNKYIGKEAGEVLISEIRNMIEYWQSIQGGPIKKTEVTEAVKFILALNESVGRMSGTSMSGDHIDTAKRLIKRNFLDSKIFKEACKKCLSDVNQIGI